jgi:hypothetical protein
MKNKIWKIGIALALVVMLAVSLAVPALAKGNDKAASATAISSINIIKGKVTVVNAAGSTFQIQPASGDAVTITVDNDTKYYQVNAALADLPAIKEQLKDKVKEMLQNHQDKGINSANQRGLGNKNPKATLTVDEANDPEEMPEMEAGLQANIDSNQGFWGKIRSAFNRGPNFGHKAAFTDIAVGDGVVVNVIPNENLAKQVLIVKPSKIKTIKGQVTAVTADSLTVTAADKTVLTLKWDANTEVTIKGAVTIKAGQYAQAVYNAETLIAKSINVRLEAPPTTTPVTETNN